MYREEKDILINRLDEKEFPFINEQWWKECVSGILKGTMIRKLNELSRRKLILGEVTINILDTQGKFMIIV